MSNSVDVADTSRFHTTLCFNGVHTADCVPLAVQSSTTVALRRQIVHADAIMERALPSRMAAAIVNVLTLAPPLSYTAVLVVGTKIHDGKMGDAIIAHVVRDQAQHRSALYDRQVARRRMKPGSGGPSPSERGDASGCEVPNFEECLLFGFKDGAVACEKLRGSGPAEAMDDALASLRMITLAVFKYSDGKVCVVLVGSHLSTAFMATLMLAPRRHAFLYFDSSITAADIVATTAEMNKVKQSFCDFIKPSSAAVTQTRTAASVRLGRDSGPNMSHVLSALAHSEEEYSLLVETVGREIGGRPQRSSSSRQNSDEVVKETVELHRCLDAAMTTKTNLEAQMKEQCRLHAAELTLMREQLQRATEAKDMAEREARVSHNLLRSFQEQSSSSASIAPPLQSTRATDVPAVDSRRTSEVDQLRTALQDALKARQFAEEKLRLMELRQTLSTTAPAIRPSLRLSESWAANPPVPPRSLSQSMASEIPASTSNQWSQSILQQENIALVAEFQRKEREWQHRLRDASAAVHKYQQENRAMRETLQLQSSTIAAAQQAILQSRTVHEEGIGLALEKVRSLSMESRSRRSHTAGGAAEQQRLAAAESGGMLSPLR